MGTDERRTRAMGRHGSHGSWTGLALMALFGLWSTVLGAGFAAVLIVAPDRVGPVRFMMFIIVATVLLGVGLRTLWELWNRLHGNKRRSTDLP